MYTQDTENLPHKRKKDSDISHAEKRSDHEHYYAADVTTVKYCDGHTYTYRRAVCIFCERRPKMSTTKRNSLEVYRTFTYHQHWSPSGHKREDCYIFTGRPPIRPDSYHLKRNL